MIFVLNYHYHHAFYYYCYYYCCHFDCHLEILDIWRPGSGLAGTWDSIAQIRDIPGNPGRVETLNQLPKFSEVLMIHN